MTASVLLMFLASLSMAAPRKAATPRYGFPKLPAGKVWVSSIPVGVEVLTVDQRFGESLGRTPLVVDAASVAKGVTFRMGRKEYGEKTFPPQMDLIDFTAEYNHTFTHREGSKDEDYARGLTYRIDASKKPTLIALFQPRTLNLSEWARRYPKGQNFSFREEPLRKDLASRGVPLPHVDSGIELLRRGGKIGFPAGDGWVIAEVQPSGDVSVFTPPPPRTPRTTPR